MICLISRTEGEGHGAEIVLENLLRGKGFNKNEICICSPVNSRIFNVAKEIGYPHLALSIHKERIVRNIIELISISPQLKSCDAIHAWQAKSYEIGWILSKLLGKKLYLTLHDHPQSSIYTYKKKSIMRFVANSSECLICVSNAVYEECTKSKYRCNMKVVHNGLIDQQFQKYKNRKVKIGFLGMYAPWKGFFLVQDYINSLKEYVDIEWYLYGNVDKNLSHTAMNIADNYPRTVFLRGHQPSSLIYSEIDILLHCSLEFDPLPTVLLEASRAGIPAIATDLGGAREIIQHKVSGFLFNPKDPSLGKSYLELLVNSEELRFRMGNAARSIYEMNFTVQNMVNHYRALWTNSW